LASGSPAPSRGSVVISILMIAPGSSGKTLRTDQSLPRSRVPEALVERDEFPSASSVIRPLKCGGKLEGISSNEWVDCKEPHRPGADAFVGLNLGPPGGRLIQGAESFVHLLSAQVLEAFLPSDGRGALDTCSPPSDCGPRLSGQGPHLYGSRFLHQKRHQGRRIPELHSATSPRAALGSTSRLSVHLLPWVIPDRRSHPAGA
jgi:hypothetical protein